MSTITLRSSFPKKKKNFWSLVVFSKILSFEMKAQPFKKKIHTTAEKSSIRFTYVKHLYPDIGTFEKFLHTL